MKGSKWLHSAACAPTGFQLQQLEWSCLAGHSMAKNQFQMPTKLQSRDAAE